jgi:hypothetical protein
MSFRTWSGGSPRAIADACGRCAFKGGPVVPRTHGQRSIFEIMLPDGEKLWDPVPRQIDDVLEDEALVEWSWYGTRSCGGGRRAASAAGRGRRPRWC